jgi:hypothetical protein
LTVECFLQEDPPKNEPFILNRKYIIMMAVKSTKNWRLNRLFCSQKFTFQIWVKESLLIFFEIWKLLLHFIVFHKTLFQLPIEALETMETKNKLLFEVVLWGISFVLFQYLKTKPNSTDFHLSINVDFSDFLSENAILRQR